MKRFIFILSWFLLIPSIAFAEIDLTKLPEGFQAKDFLGDLVEEQIKSAIRGDVPSDDFHIITSQVYDKFLSGGYATKKKYTPCQRAANAQAETALSDLKNKWWQGGWFDVSYSVIKYTGTIGTAGLLEVLKEEGRAKIKELMTVESKKQPPEIVQLSNGGKCDLQTSAVWDKKNSKVSIAITGNCNCRTVRPRMFGLTKAKLKDFTILIEAPISIKNVKIKNKNRFAFWKKDYEIRLYYKVGSLTVDTQANCQCSKIIDPPPEPEDDVTPPEDEVVDPPEEPEDEIEKSCSEGEYETDSVCRGACRDGECSGKRISGNIFSGKYCYACERKCEQGEYYSTARFTNPCLNKCAEDEVCMDRGNNCHACEKRNACPKIDIDGRTGVKTTTDGVNCDGMCGKHQICTDAGSRYVGDRLCYYCQNKCPDGEFYAAKFCNATCGEDQECKPSGNGRSCFACVDKEVEEEPEDRVSPPEDRSSCEQAVRQVLDVYLGWWDPPLAQDGSTFVFTVPDHRCLTESEFDQFHRSLAIEGVVDSSIQELCPGLKHVSSEEVLISSTGGAKGNTCVSKTVFSF